MLTWFSKVSYDTGRVPMTLAVQVTRHDMLSSVALLGTALELYQALLSQSRYGDTTITVVFPAPTKATPT